MRTLTARRRLGDRCPYPRIRQATGAATINTPNTIINATTVLTKQPPPPPPANRPDSRAA
ncbi:hypothetical protein [Nocardia concava]|uniref:hypothetical protein n=1 Tax=Nocardia concava TaxID=257281 RepID=UPI0012FB76E8|nr:hypothetical protein [Nocardia concava]